MIPGEMHVAAGDIELNTGRATVTLDVANKGDRPIQVGSHYHFYETNDALSFDRALAYGCRLNIAAGTAVRWTSVTSSVVDEAPEGGSVCGKMTVNPETGQC